MLLAALAMLCALGVLPASAQTQSMAEPVAPALRLPAGARPLHYAVILTVVPGAAKVAGEVAIDVELDRAHPLLWLNADALTVSGATVELADTRVDVLSGHDQFVGLGFSPPLPAGRHRLTLSYEAEQSRNSTRGIFTLEDGGAWYAMTQFEATSARRAFPCFDEPGFKVPWQLTLRVPRNLVAVSNTPVASEADVANGLKAVRFAETRPLPSYLIAFAVGPWEFVDLGKVGERPTPMRVIVPRGRAADTAFVAKAYPELFARMERWFGLRYPYEKLDHVAIPLTVGFAMENVGLITYGMTNLLAKPGAVTARFRHGAASIGAHEMAHQWYGNLVTAAWWDDIWLNEAFATWFAEKMVDEWRPDYERGAARIQERNTAIAADALTSARRIREPIVSRGDIGNAFDSITYQKGATVIGMIEGWIGKESFRTGVRRYLESRRDANATATDFLESLGKASDRPVGPVFSSFLDQNGVPEVAVGEKCTADGATLELAQRRLSPLGVASSTGQRWQIPLCVRYGDGNSTRETCTLMTDLSATLRLEGACPAFVFANSGGRGYYVADYRGDLLTRLAVNRAALSTPEYASFVYDLRALVQSGSVSGAQALEWVRAAAASPDRHVVVASIELATLIRDKLLDDADRAQFSAFVRDAFGARARALGFVPRSGESDDEELMRRSLMLFVAPEDPVLTAEARRLAKAWLVDRAAVDPGIADIVLIVAGRTGDAAALDTFINEALATSDRRDRSYLMGALFSFSDPALAQRGMGVLLDERFDMREAMTALWRTKFVSPPRRETHAFIEANFDALAKRVSRDSPGGWPEFAAGLCSAKDRADIEAFWRGRIANYAGGEHELAQALESIELCTKLRAAAHADVHAFLARPRGADTVR